MERESRTQDVVDAIVRIHAALMAHPLDRLNEERAALCLELLDILSFTQDTHLAAAVLDDPAVRSRRDDLRRHMASAAFLYELQWSRTLSAADDPAALTESDYPFHDHYRRATELEYHAARTLARRPLRRILMVGCGPLPSTAFQLAHLTGARIDALERDPVATEAAGALTTRLGLDGRVRCITSDLRDYARLGDYDAVWLAALAGEQEEKTQLLAHHHRHMAPGALLLARTAADLRTLLYARIRVEDLAAFNVHLLLQPYSRNFHTSLIAEQPDGGAASPDGQRRSVPLTAARHHTDAEAPWPTS